LLAFNRTLVSGCWEYARLSTFQVVKMLSHCWLLSYFKDSLRKAIICW